MEWIDLFKFVLIEDIKNLIFYLRIKQKDVYLINNTHAYEVKKAKEDAAGNVPAPPSVVDPDNP